VILNLVRFDADDGPVARGIRVIDVATLDLVRAERRPPDALRCTCESERDWLGDHRCT
jgi:hypothetical protein